MTDLDPSTTTPEGDYEPAADAAPAASVVPPATSSSGGRARWAVALGVIVLVVVATALAISLFTGRAASAIVLGYVPEDAIIYGETRLDLPGDQRQAVGQFLSKFPGFADQAAIDTKLDEVLDRLVGEATDGDQVFSSDIKPWFGGELAFSVGALPDPAGLSGSEPDPAAMKDARFLALVSVKDEAIASAWFDAAVAKSGAQRSSETYGGTTVQLFTAEGEPQGAYALLGGKVAVVGDVASVKAAVDTKGASGFATQPNPKAALDSTTGDHVGFVYVALRPLLEWATRLSETGIGGGVSSDVLMDLVPDWAAVAMRVEGDALVVESLAATTKSAAVAESRVSVVADHVPSSTVALTVSHDCGKGILQTLETYRSDPNLKPALEAIDGAIGVLGGADAAIGWIGDLGIALNRVDGTLEGGLVIVPTERAAADRLFTSLRTLVSLAGATAGISLRDEPYAGTTIIVVDLGELGDLAGQAGLSPEQLGSVSLPSGHVELAYAITDEVIVLGSGPEFVKHILDTTAETALSSNERYKALGARVGNGNGTGFADLTAIRELIESGLAGGDAAARAQYEQDVKPFLTPFDALVGSTSITDGVSRSTVIVTVK